MHRNRNLRTALGLGVLCALAGCLPVELSISPEGEVLIPRREGFVVYKPSDGTVRVWYAARGEDRPAFALYAPDGRRALAFTTSAGGGSSGQTVKVMLLEPEGKTRELLTRTNVTYARWSPDGRFATLTRLAEEKVEPLDQNMPQLLLLDPASPGTAKVLASNVAAVHRWLPDGKSILLFQIERKEANNRYDGKLVLLDAVDGRKKVLAALAMEQGAFYLDVSPDGTTAAVTALAMAKPDAVLPEKADTPGKLFSVSLSTGEFRPLADEVAFALYSPRGTRLLLGGASEKDGTISLRVAAPDGSSPREVADDAVRQTGGMNAAAVYPVWLDDETILYLSRYAVYGTAGTNLMLTSVRADGRGEKILHQAKIDAALLGGKP